MASSWFDPSQPTIGEQLRDQVLTDSSTDVESYAKALLFTLIAEAKKTPDQRPAGGRLFAELSKKLPTRSSTLPFNKIFKMVNKQATSQNLRIVISVILGQEGKVPWTNVDPNHVPDKFNELIIELWW